MTDRNVQYPNRYQLVKVEGTDNIYDMIPAPGTVEDEGTLINKATLLKDATAALFGLWTDAVPDDALAKLGPYMQYWWHCRAVDPHWEPAYSAIEELAISILTTDTDISNPDPVYASKTISIDDTGKVTLVNPQLVKITVPNGNLYTLRGMYFYDSYYDSNGLIYYAKPDAAAEFRRVGSNYYGYIDCAKVTGYYNSNAGPWEYIQSNNRTAYPDSGVTDGVEYKYLGVPLDNAIGARAIETGYYTGTEASLSVTLNFNMEPQFVYVTAKDARNYYAAIFAKDATSTYLLVNSSYGLNYSLSGQTLTWTQSGVNSYQMALNSAVQYYYIAIG